MRRWLLLLLWLVLGTSLRLILLEAKPPWTDEFSTMAFSLGNGFHSVPLDQAIAINDLLRPIQVNPNAGIADVLQRLFSETNHPPLYFMLSHWWLQLFSSPHNELASVWVARSLSVLFGALSIPAIYGISWLAFRSQLVSQLTAAMMAVSPYGIFIAQEARHYTLAILWVIASLGCLVIASRHIHCRMPIPVWLLLSWIGINFLGISTHYFFVLTLISEALWLLVLAWHQMREKHSAKLNQPRQKSNRPWWQISIVVISTIIGCLAWLPMFWLGNRGGELTKWIKISDRNLLDWISPVFQSLGIWLSMVYLLPVSVQSIIVVVMSGIGMLGFFIWGFPILKRGIITQLEQPTMCLRTQLFGVVVIGANLLFFILTYIFGIDITRGARYHFVYFPSVVVLLGVSLAACWNTPTKRQKLLPSSGKKAVAIILLIGLISGLGVVWNWSYPKYYRPDLFVPLVQKVSQSPVLIATTHRTHVQTGEMMGVAWVLKLSNSSFTPLFLLAHQNKNPQTSTLTLQRTLNQLPRPLDLWLVNFHAPVEELKGCSIDPRSFPAIHGYEYQFYHCSAATS